MAISGKNAGSKTHIVKSQAELEALLSSGAISNGDVIVFNGVSTSIFTGAGAPTTSTEAFTVGDMYFDTTNNVFYDCTGISVASDVYTYTWIPRIKGATIGGTDATVTDGNIVVPIAGNTPGVMKPGGGLVTDSTTGLTSINKALDSEIEGKSEVYNAIVPANLDKAIEEGLGNYSGTAFTDAKKERACHTIGLLTEDTVDRATWAAGTYTGNKEVVFVTE